MKREIVTILFFLLFFQPISGFSQQGEIDSIEAIQWIAQQDTSKIKLLIAFCQKLKTSDPEKALKYSNQALILSEKLNYYEGIISSLNNIGVIYSYQGEYKKATEYFMQSLAIGKKIDDKQGIATSLNNIGNTYLTQSNYTKALYYFEQSLEIKEKIGDQNGIAKTLNNIALIYADQKNYNKALEYYQQSLEIIKKIGDESEIALLLNNIGAIYNIQGLNEKALEYYSLSKKISEEIGNKNGVAVSLANIGYTYVEQNNNTKGLYYYTQSLILYEETLNKKGMALILQKLGEIYFSLHYYQESINYYERSMSLAKEIGLNRSIKDIFQTLSEAYAKILNFQKAYEYSYLLLKINDSIFNIENSKNITEMQTKYETEKKEKEITVLQKEKAVNELQLTKQKNLNIISVLSGIILLITSVALFALFYQKRKTNKILTEINQKLAASEAGLLKLNQTKNQFFSIISHDLRGPLASIKSSMNMFLENPDTFSKTELTQFTKSILKSIDNVSSLFENLLNWSKTETNQINFHPVEFDFHDVIRESCQLTEIKLQQKNISLISTVAVGTMVYADENMIKFVVRNLIENAVKFTGQNGKVEIVTKEKEIFLEIAVIDNGIGISAENLSKLFESGKQFSTAGTDNEKGTGLGLMLCKEFIKRNGGEIWVESQPDIGSKFFFTIPLGE